MISIGGLPKHESFFMNIDSFMKKEDWAVFVATLNEKPIAALLGFYFNNTVEYFTPVIKVEFRNTQALPFLIYSAMKDAISMGYINWNWGGTWLTQSGVYDFKKKWNTKDYPYFYYTRVYNDVIYKKTPDYLQSEYYGFYTCPFSKILTKKER